MTRSKAQKLLPGPSMSEPMLTYIEGDRRESPASPAIPGLVAMFSIAASTETCLRSAISFL